MFLFVGLILVNAGEALYAASLCRANGFTASNTARWMLSVFVNGAFALSLIPTPPTVMAPENKSSQRPKQH